jgi:hypothetical protein
MYTVQMEHECGCFKKSEYSNNKSFDTQRDAYNYANIVTELMNEEFCTKHLFVAQRAGDNEFMIRVVENPNAGSSCSTSSGASSCDTGSCGC